MSVAVNDPRVDRLLQWISGLHALPIWDGATIDSSFCVSLKPLASNGTELYKHAMPAPVPLARVELTVPRNGMISPRTVRLYLAERMSAAPLLSRFVPWDLVEKNAEKNFVIVAHALDCDNSEPPCELIIGYTGRSSDAAGVAAISMRRPEIVDDLVTFVDRIPG